MIDDVDKSLRCLAPTFVLAVSSIITIVTGPTRLNLDCVNKWKTCY